MESKYEFLSDGLDGLFLKAWALSTFDSNAEFEDDLFTFCSFDGI